MEKYIHLLKSLSSILFLFRNCSLRGPLHYARAAMDIFSLGLGQGKKKKSTAIENVIDQNYLWELKQFYNQDECIRECRKKKFQEFMKHEFSIGWWFEEEVELTPIPVMNEKPYKRVLNEMLWCANDYLDLFGFVGFYIRKDLTKWLESKEKNGGLLPFGVIEFGERKDVIPGYFVKRSKKKTLFGSEIIFVCTDDSKRAKYVFYVMEKNATFKLPTQVINRNNFCPEEAVENLNLLPNSSFEPLFHKWKRITELTLTLDDANAQSCRPEPFLTTKPLPESQIEEASEPDRYLSNMLDEATTAVTMDKLQSGFDYVDGHSKRMKLQTTQTQLQSQRYGGGRFRSITEQRRLLFPRPTMTENLEVLPPLVTLDRGPPPKSLINIDHLEEVYEAKVCSVMCYPYLLFKAHSQTHATHSTKTSGSGGISNTSQLESAREDLNKTIMGQEELFQEIFHELYMRSYAFLDLEALSHIPQSKLPEFQPLLKGIKVRLVYNHKSPKSNMALQNLAGFYNDGIITKTEARLQLDQGYNFDMNGGSTDFKISDKPLKPLQPKKEKKQKSSSSSSSSEDSIKKEKKRKKGKEEELEQEPKKKKKTEKST